MKRKKRFYCKFVPQVWLRNVPTTKDKAQSPITPNSPYLPTSRHTFYAAGSIIPGR